MLQHGTLFYNILNGMKYIYDSLEKGKQTHEGINTGRGETKTEVEAYGGVKWTPPLHHNSFIQSFKTAGMECGYMIAMQTKTNPKGSLP